MNYFKHYKAVLAFLGLVLTIGLTNAIQKYQLSYFLLPLFALDAYDKDYCWLHGTKCLAHNEISKVIQNGYTCADKNDDPDENATNYYIWVSLVLFLSGAAFALPNEL